MRVRFGLRFLLTWMGLFAGFLAGYIVSNPFSTVMLGSLLLSLAFISGWRIKSSSPTFRTFYICFVVVVLFGMGLTAFAHHPVSNVNLLRSIWWNISRDGDWLSFFGSCRIVNFYLIVTLIAGLTIGALSLLSKAAIDQVLKE